MVSMGVLSRSGRSARQGSFATGKISDVKQRESAEQQRTQHGDLFASIEEKNRRRDFAVLHDEFAAFFIRQWNNGQLHGRH